MFAHRLLVKKLTIGSKKSLKILKKFSFTEISTTNSNYSSFKDEKPEQPGALLLKLASPVCDRVEGKKCEDIFINKTTGEKRLQSKIST